MKRLLLILLLTVPMAAQASGENVVFADLPHSVSREVERRAERLVNRLGAEAPVADSVSLWLSRLGYLDARADPVEGRWIVTAGEKYFLDRLLIAGDSTRQIMVNRPFTPDNLAKAVTRLLDEYRRDGHYYARAGIHQVVRSGARVTVTLSVNVGPVVKVGNNRFIGLVHSDPTVIDRHLTAGPGDILTEATIERAERSAVDIDFVTYHPPVSVRPRSGYTEADLEYRFSEKKRFSLFGGGGYSPNDDGGLLWNLRATFRNLFGQGREAQVFSERREKGRQALQISYSQPVYLLGVGKAHFDVSTRDYRDDFYEFSLETGYHTRLTGLTMAGLSVGWKRVEPTADLAGFSRYKAGFSVGRETILNRTNPESGYRLHTELAYAYRRYSGDSLVTPATATSFNETRTALTLEVYQPLIGSLVGHASLNYRGLETSEPLPPISELYLLGGPGSIRGYRNEQFDARRAAFGTVEPRLRFYSGFLFVFFDAAYINRPTLASGSVTADELFRSGYGVGLSLSDSQRSVKISLGWGKDSAFDEPQVSVELGSDL